MPVAGQVRLNFLAITAIYRHLAIHAQLPCLEMPGGMSTGNPTVKSLAKDITVLENEFRDAREDFVQKSDNLDERFREIMDKLEATNAALEKNNTAFEISMEAAGLRDKTILRMGRLLEIKDEEIAELKERVEKLERKDINRNLLIHNVPTRFPCIKIVEDLFKLLECPFSTTQCAAIYRRPSPNTSEDRPHVIVVELQFARFKKNIYEKIANLRGNKDWEGIRITDDLTNEQKATERDLRGLAKLAKDEGYTAKVKGRTLVVNNKRFTKSNLRDLPPVVTLQRSNTVQLPNGLAFQGANAEFSNWYPCEVPFEGTKYKSAEHAFHATRAARNGYHTLALMMELAPSAVTVKRLSHRIPKEQENLEWRKGEIKVLHDVVMQKFESNPALRQKLLDTGDQPLYEATGDKRWGTGHWNQKQLFGTERQTGKNEFGKLLVEIRQEIRLAYNMDLNSEAPVPSQGDNEPIHRDQPDQAGVEVGAVGGVAHDPGTDEADDY